jgi:hypothetical protein
MISVKLLFNLTSYMTIVPFCSFSDVTYSITQMTSQIHQEIISKKGHNSRKEKVVKSEIVLGLPIMDPDFLYKCV